jgi:hypothetical protein
VEKSIDGAHAKQEGIEAKVLNHVCQPFKAHTSTLACSGFCLDPEKADKCHYNIKQKSISKM